MCMSVVLQPQQTDERKAREHDQQLEQIRMLVVALVDQHLKRETCESVASNGIFMLLRKFDFSLLYFQLFKEPFFRMR